MLKKLNNQNFQNEIIENTGIVLVDFYADWCSPCKMLSPIIDEIAEECTDITVGKVNVDENNSLAAKYNVMSIPTMIIFKNGKEQARVVGVRPKEDILAELQ